jgi:MoxR-like ATPase
MERCAAALAQREPVLLVGETGTGKTTTLSHLAQLVGLWGLLFGGAVSFLSCADLGGARVWAVLVKFGG